MTVTSMLTFSFPSFTQQKQFLILQSMPVWSKFAPVFIVFFRCNSCTPIGQVMIVFEDQIQLPQKRNFGKKIPNSECATCSRCSKPKVHEAFSRRLTSSPYGHCELERLGGGEDEVTYHKKIRWLQLLKDFHCTVTSTWVDADDPGDCHTWRAWGSRVRKKKKGSHYGTSCLQSTTWFLSKIRLRTWD